MTPGLRHPGAAGTLLLAVMLTLTAIPSLARQRNADRPGRRVEARLDRLADRIDLTDAQKRSIRDVLAVDEETGRAGDLWMVAAVLHRDLSADQKKKLFDAARRTAVYRRGMRAGMRRAARADGRHAMRRAEPRQGVVAPRAGARRMQQALGLTDDQIQILRIHQALTGMTGARAGVRAPRSRRDQAPAPRMRRGR